jgi:hypothetical protein
MPETIDSRPFSYFWDQDISLNTKDNPYTFTMSNSNRKITVFYKISTKIVNLKYDGTIITGKLLDEFDDKIIENTNRNVEFYYYENGWNYIDSVDSSFTDGSFSFAWNCPLQQTNIQARYTPVDQNWFYTFSSAEKEYIKTTKNDLTIETMIYKDYPNHPLPDVYVQLCDGSRCIPTRTNENGVAVIEDLTEGKEYEITMPETIDSRSFSYFWDQGISLNTKNNPYTFTMSNSNRKITVFYKISTKIEGLKFNNLQLTGKLLDEFNQPLNGKVNIEYQSYDNFWHPTNPGIAESSSEDGSWSYNVNFNEIKRRFRVSYTPENDNYNSTSNTLIVGDFNYDKKCDIVDISLVAKDFGCNKVIIDDFEDGNSVGWNAGCSGANKEMITGFNSNWALKISTTNPAGGLACAIRSNYNAVKERKITYACYGSRCMLGVWDGSKYINDNTCNLNTGQCFSGGGLVGITCGNNLVDWTICETTITETNPSVDIWIYNDGGTGSSVYDSIKEDAWTRTSNWAGSTGLCDKTNCPVVDINGDEVIDILDITMVAKNFGIQD